MSSPASDNLIVFISYSHDSDKHKDRVLALSDRLRADGIDCIIDQYEISPSVGWPTWCENQIDEADFILVACTEIYLHIFKRKDATEKGKGAKWEGYIITQQLYDAQLKNEKFIPILFTDGDSAIVPSILRGVTSYQVFTEEGYDSL
ncbi:MAG: SEFIR domain-containing protein [Methanobacterium sp.]